MFSLLSFFDALNPYDQGKTSTFVEISSDQGCAD